MFWSRSAPAIRRVRAPKARNCFDRFDLRLEVVAGVRRREAQGPLGLRIEDIGAPASTRGVSGIRDGHNARGMARGGGDLARYTLHEDVVAPARGSVEELDHVVSGTDHSGLEVRRVPGAGEEALEDGAPRGQLGRRGEHVFIVLVVGIRRAAGSARTFVIEGRSSVVRKAAKSPVAAGSVSFSCDPLQPATVGSLHSASTALGYAPSALCPCIAVPGPSLCPQLGSARRYF